MKSGEMDVDRVIETHGLLRKRREETGTSVAVGDQNRDDETSPSEISQGSGTPRRRK